MADDINQKAQDIIDLIHGKPGPYLESDRSFFGQKRVDPTMKDALMETDCGGMLITKSKLTYGEANALAEQVDLSRFSAFLDGLTPATAPACYWHTESNGLLYIGTVWWVVYSYLATEGIIEGKPTSYNNTLEYLFDKVLRRLEAEGVFEADAQRRYFSTRRHHELRIVAGAPP
jgi:hypothetical protein